MLACTQVNAAFLPSIRVSQQYCIMPKPQYVDLSKNSRSFGASAYKNEGEFQGGYWDVVINKFVVR